MNKKQIIIEIESTALKSDKEDMIFEIRKGNQKLIIAPSRPKMGV